MKAHSGGMGLIFSREEVEYIQPHILASTIWWPKEEVDAALPDTEFSLDAENAVILLSVFSESSIRSIHERRARNRYVQHQVAQAALNGALEKANVFSAGLAEALKASQEHNAQSMLVSSGQNSL